MNEFMTLMWRFFIIVCLQFSLDLFIDKDNKPTLGKMLQLACNVGSLLLLLEYVINNLLPEMMRFAQMAF